MYNIEFNIDNDITYIMRLYSYIIHVFLFYFCFGLR